MARKRATATLCETAARSRACRESSLSHRSRKYPTSTEPIVSRGTAARSGSRRLNSAAAAKSLSLLPKYRITIAGSIPAAAARILAFVLPFCRTALLSTNGNPSWSTAVDIYEQSQQTLTYKKCPSSSLRSWRQLDKQRKDERTR